MEQAKLEIIYKTIGSLIRNLFRIVAIYAFKAGVDEETYGQFTEVAINYLVPIVILGFTEGLTFLRNRTAVYRSYYAAAAPAGTTMAEIDAMVSKRTPPAVSV